MVEYYVSNNDPEELVLERTLKSWRKEFLVYRDRTPTSTASQLSLSVPCQVRLYRCTNLLLLLLYVKTIEDIFRLNMLYILKFGRLVDFKHYAKK